MEASSKLEVSSQYASLQPDWYVSQATEGRVYLFHVNPRTTDSSRYHVNNTNSPV
jgi:hypothetical protein